jgi:putative transposase
MLIFGRWHLERVLVEFIEHYNQARPHQGIEQRRPCEPANVVSLPIGPIERRDRLGGIIHEYSRVA